MEAKRQAIIDLTCASRSTKKIAVALNVHRKTANNVEEDVQRVRRCPLFHAEVFVPKIPSKR